MRSHKILAVACITMVLLGCAWQFRSTDKPKYIQETYYVHTGDTLWDLSAEYCDANQDRREWVYEVSKLNGTANIRGGQEIIILVKEDNDANKN